MPQPGAEAHCRAGGKILGSHRAQQAHQPQADHDQAHPDDVAFIPAADARVHNARHHQGHQQLQPCLQQLEERSENALLLEALHIFDDLFQRIHLLFWFPPYLSTFPSSFQLRILSHLRQFLYQCPSLAIIRFVPEADPR